MIVTVAREFGTGAIDIARIVAERCGLQLLNEELAIAAADKLGIERDAVLSDEDSIPDFFERCLMQFPGATYDIGTIPMTEQPDIADLVRRQIEHTLIDVSSTLDAVIMGRAADMILGIRWDVVRVFLHAPLRWRIARVMEVLRCDERAARKMIERTDQARERYCSEYYGHVWSDVRRYDLSIDTSRMGITEAADIIISVVASRYYRE